VRVTTRDAWVESRASSGHPCWVYHQHYVCYKDIFRKWARRSGTTRMESLLHMQSLWWEFEWWRELCSVLWNFPFSRKEAVPVSHLWPNTTKSIKDSVKVPCDLYHPLLTVTLAHEFSWSAWTPVDSLQVCYKSNTLDLW
jgi:hypothetical protein